MHPVMSSCGFSRDPATLRCRFMVTARFADSARRTPSRRTTSPLSDTLLRTYVEVGAIFIRSVHQRNIRVGAGYPRPIRFTQNVWSGSGVVFTTTMGKCRFSAAVCNRPSILSMYAVRIGDSTRVSLQRMWTGRLRSPGARSSSISKTSWTSNVLSLPPEYPMIQGSWFAERYSSRMSDWAARSRSSVPSAIEDP